MIWMISKVWLMFWTITFIQFVTAYQFNFYEFENLYWWTFVYWTYLGKKITTIVSPNIKWDSKWDSNVSPSGDRLEFLIYLHVFLYSRLMELQCISLMAVSVWKHYVISTSNAEFIISMAPAWHQIYAKRHSLIEWDCETQSWGAWGAVQYRISIQSSS